MRVKGWIPLLLFISAAAVVQAANFSNEDQIPDEVARGDSDESGEDEKAFQGEVQVRNCALPLDEPAEADADVALIEEKGLGKWTDHPVRESDLTIDRDCDCSVKWIKKVYPIMEVPYRKSKHSLSPAFKVYPIREVPYRKSQPTPSSTFKLKYTRDEPTGYDGHHIELHHLSSFGFPPPNCKPCNVLKKHPRRRYHHITDIKVDKIEVPYRNAHHQFSPSSTFKLKYTRDEPTGYDGHHVELHHLSGFGFPPPNCKPCNVLKNHRRRRYHHITHIKVDKIHHTEIVHHRIDIHHVKHIQTVHKCSKEEKKKSVEVEKLGKKKKEKKKSVEEAENLTIKKKEKKEEKKHSAPDNEKDHEKMSHHHKKRHHHHHHKKHHHKKKCHHKHHHKKHHEKKSHKKKKLHQHHHHHHHSHHKQHQKHHYSRLTTSDSSN